MISKKGVARAAAVAAVVVGLCSSAALAEVKYTVMELGTLPGYPYSWANSVGDNGLVVGNVSGAMWVSTATVFDSTGNGHIVDLGSAVAISVNSGGQIVGQAYTTQNYWRATLFDSTGHHNNIDLGTLVGGWLSTARSINDNGQIVGESNMYFNGNLYSMRATLFDSTGSGLNRDLGALAGYEGSTARSINNNGLIVGVSISGNTGRATIFDGTGYGNHSDLGLLPFGRESWAKSVNDNGQIVGLADNFMGQWHATLFDPTGGGRNVDLGALPGHTASDAWCINNGGVIVGESRTSNDDYTSRRATLFDSTGAGHNVDLNTLIDPSLGFTLYGATDVNDSGWIVGWGAYSDGAARAFLLTPIPEPATLSLLAVGGMALLRRRRTASS